MRCPVIYKRNRVKLNWTICFEMQKWDNPSEGTRPLEMRNSTIAVPYKDLMLTKDLLDAQQLSKVKITVMNQQWWLDCKTIFHILCRQRSDFSVDVVLTWRRETIIYESLNLLTSWYNWVSSLKILAMFITSIYFEATIFVKLAGQRLQYWS